MATLRRSHALSAQVETMVWQRSRSGRPRRRRSDRPPLTHDSGWDWDGTRILFNGKMVMPDGEEHDYEVCKSHLREDGHPPVATLSLLDIAQYRVSKRSSQVRSGLDDFEVIRIPEVVPISEEEPDPGDRKLGEWEKLDALGVKRTYSEVVQGFVDEKGSPDTAEYSGLAQGDTEDDPWVCL